MDKKAYLKVAVAAQKASGLLRQGVPGTARDVFCAALKYRGFYCFDNIIADVTNADANTELLPDAVAALGDALDFASNSPVATQDESAVLLIQLSQAVIDHLQA